MEVLAEAAEVLAEVVHQAAGSSCLMMPKLEYMKALINLYVNLQV